MLWFLTWKLENFDFIGDDSKRLDVLPDHQAETWPQFLSERWDEAKWELPFQPLSLFFSLFDHCLQFPTFFSVTWATNQVPDSRAAARLEGFEPTGLLTLHSA